MALPVMTPEQRTEALAKAAEARAARSAALRELTAGTLTAADALAGSEPRLLKVKVRRVLLAVPGIGNARADKLMAAAGVGPSRRVAGLGARQRADLTGLLTA